MDKIDRTWSYSTNDKERSNFIYNINDSLESLYIRAKWKLEVRNFYKL